MPKGLVKERLRTKEQLHMFLQCKSKFLCTEVVQIGTIFQGKGVSETVLHKQYCQSTGNDTANSNIQNHIFH